MKFSFATVDCLGKQQFSVTRYTFHVKDSTLWSTVLECPAAVLLLEYPVICVPGRFVTVNTRIRHLYEPWASWIEFTDFRCTSSRCILVTPFRLLRPTKGVFLPSIFSPKLNLQFFISPIHIYCSAHLSPCTYDPRSIPWRRQFTDLLTVEYGLDSWSFSLAGPKYSP